MISNFNLANAKREKELADLYMKEANVQATIARLNSERGVDTAK